MRENTYHFHDTHIQIWTSINEDRDTYHAIFELLGRNGFDIERWPGMKKRHYSISKYYHHSSKEDLQARLEIHPACISIDFYQNLVFENPNGGQYDFDKLQKMPYLIRLQFLCIWKKIFKLLDERGFQCTTEPPIADQFEYAQSRHHKGYPMGMEKDRDGVILENGMIRWARYYDGRLFRGVIYWDGGNMWNVVANSKLRFRCASFELFSYDPAIHPRKLHYRSIDRLYSELKKAVEAEDFERAIKLRDARKRLEKVNP
jgi:hypothetical protein